MHNATVRIIKILNYLSKQTEGKTLTEITNDLEIPKGTIFPMIKTLEAYNYIVNDEFNRYTIGPQTYIVGSTYTKQTDILQDIEIEIKNMSNTIEQTCYFAVLDEGNGFYLIKQSVPIPVSISAKPGVQIPAYATGIGKALLSDHTLEDLKLLYPDKLVPLQKNTLSDLNSLYEQILEVQKTGFSYEDQESTEYVKCVATPIKYQNKVIAAISIAAPIFFYDDPFEENAKNVLLKTRKNIENIIASNIDEWRFSPIK